MTAALVCLAYYGMRYFTVFAAAWGLSAPAAELLLGLLLTEDVLGIYAEFLAEWRACP